jgi:hypothetical protein
MKKQNKHWKNGREQHNSQTGTPLTVPDYKINVNVALQHLPGLINLTQEFNEKGDTELVGKTLEFMKGFLKMVETNEDD